MAWGGPLPGHNSAIRGILSPVELAGRSLQFVVSFRPTELEEEASSETDTNGIRKLWIMEIHARFERVVFTPSSSLASSSGLPSASTLSMHSSGGRGGHTSPNSGHNSHSGGAAMTHHSSESPKSGPQSFKFSRSSGKTPTRPHSVGPLALTPPSRLYALELGRLLGRGSFGTVYSGFLGEVPVAVKVIEAAVGREWQQKQWDARLEATIALDMVHDNVIRTLDWCHCEDTTSGRVWIVQELCDMGSLSAAVDRGMLCVGHVKGEGPDMRAVLETAVEIARGMAYLHSRDVLHADLSSNNVLLVSADNYRGFTAKVTDFGMSRFGGREQATQTFGTVSHM